MAERIEHRVRNGVRDLVRPMGHVWGTDVLCTACGVSWDAHRADPHPCTTVARCPEGHEMTPGNVYRHAHGDMGCRLCLEARRAVERAEREARADAKREASTDA